MLMHLLTNTNGALFKHRSTPDSLPKVWTIQFSLQITTVLQLLTFIHMKLFRQKQVIEKNNTCSYVYSNCFTISISKQYKQFETYLDTGGTTANN